MEEGGAGVDGADNLDADGLEQALGRLTSAEMLPDAAAAFQPPPAVLRASEDGRAPGQGLAAAEQPPSWLLRQPSEIEPPLRRLSDGMRLLKEETGRARRLSNP